MFRMGMNLKPPVCKQLAQLTKVPGTKRADHRYFEGCNRYTPNAAILIGCLRLPRFACVRTRRRKSLNLRVDGILLSALFDDRRVDSAGATRGKNDQKSNALQRKQSNTRKEGSTAWLKRETSCSKQLACSWHIYGQRFRKDLFAEFILGVCYVAERGYFLLHCILGVPKGDTGYE